MQLEIENVNVQTVWRDTFVNKKGEEIEYFRTLLTIPGEAPLQLAVNKNDFEYLQSKSGETGTAVVELDAKPGSRTKVIFKDLV